MPLPNKRIVQTLTITGMCSDWCHLQIKFVVPQVLGSILSRTMLLSIEVAVEYWLSLTWSPQAQWLSDSTHDSPLRDEVSLLLHADLAWCTILSWGSCLGDPVLYAPTASCFKQASVPYREHFVKMLK